MKKIILYSIFLLSLGLFTTSCYDDKSTSATETPAVKIDTTGFNYTNALIEVPQGATLTLKPVVTQDGIDNPDLSYEWRLTISTIQGGEFATVSTEKELNEVILRRSDTKPYYLSYEVTDNRTNIKYNVFWRVVVVKASGDGIIVADTRDGSTTDLSMVRAKGISAGYNGETLYKRNIYSNTNGASIPGLVKQLTYSTSTDVASKKTSSIIYSLTDRSVMSLDPELYEVIWKDNELFFAPPTVMAPQGMVNGYLTQFFVNNGDLYPFLTGVANRFGKSMTYQKPGSTIPKDVVNGYLVTTPQLGSKYPFATFYDDANGRFSYVTNYGSEAKIAAVYNNSTAAGAFDPANVSGMQQIGSGMGANSDHIHILKDKTSGTISFYTLKMFNTAGSGEDKTEVPASESKLTTTACNEIEQAIEFATCENRNVVYYATPTKVYAAQLVGTSASASIPQFTTQPNEQITRIQLFREAWYMMLMSDPTKTPMPENCNQLLVATYNTTTSEGKLYVLPIKNLAGTLDAPTPEKTYGGFGKITALGMQGK